MNNFFDYAFQYLLHDEGSTYTNHPKDPGGPTKFGVTLKAYQAHVDHPVEAFDIEVLTEAQAKDFYFVRYWKSLNCDRLKSGAIAVCIFDCAVLYGQGTAAKMAQLAVSRCGATLKFDGILGDSSIAMLNLVGADEFLKHVHDLILERIDHVLKINPAEEVFRNGWTNRADRLLTLSTDPILNQPGESS